VQLKDRKQATKDDFEKSRETAMLALVSAKKAEALALYVRRLRDKSKSVIKTDESYLVDHPLRDGGAPPALPEEEEEP
jgi:hypothetical protein